MFSYVSFKQFLTNLYLLRFIFRSENKRTELPVVAITYYFMIAL